MEFWSDPVVTFRSEVDVDVSNDDCGEDERGEGGPNDYDGCGEDPIEVRSD